MSALLPKSLRFKGWAGYLEASNEVDYGLAPSDHVRGHKDQR